MVRVIALMILGTLGTLPVAYGGQATGTVNSVNVNPGWGGVFVQLNIPTTQVYEPACPEANWAFLPISSPYYGSFLASFLAARASGETITVYTDGCVAASYGSVPHISLVDYGVRMSGT
jgi:hypothetical protein